MKLRYCLKLQKEINTMTKRLICSMTLLLAISASGYAEQNTGIGPRPVNLGKAGTFTILSKTGITDVHASAVTGNVGTSPITGAALLLTCREVAGTVYTVDATGPLPCRVNDPSLLGTAVGDMDFAYDDAASRVLPDFIKLGAGEIGGRTLVPGLYKWGIGVTISKDVTLSGGPNDVWIFQIAGTLNQASATKVILAGGALAKNIFWQVAGGVSSGYLRALRRRHTGKDIDRPEHRSIGEWQTVGADCGHSSEECGYAAGLQVSPHTSPVGLTLALSSKASCLT